MSNLAKILLGIAVCLFIGVAARAQQCGAMGAWKCDNSAIPAALAPTPPAPAKPADDPPAALALTTPSAPIVPGARVELNSTVYIEPMDGFENYLAAALLKKKVPLIAIANQATAEYLIKGTWEEKKAGFAKMFVFGQIHSDDSASVQMIDQRSGQIVFAYAVNKKNTWHGDQTTAEACAKHLKQQIEK
jgi:hypothetical protein